MKLPAKKVDLCSIERATSYAKDSVEFTINRALLITVDKDKDERMKIAECVNCFKGYGSSRAGGSVSTSIECALCDKVVQFDNTCVDVVCVECAKREMLCKHCGADIDLKYRRTRHQPVNLRSASCLKED